MKKYIMSFGVRFSAYLTATILSSIASAEAIAGGDVNLGQMVSSTGGNVATFPKLISAACYVGGAAFIGTGVMKVKQHVDNPQTPLREGLVRLAAGGVLVAAPAMTAVMTNTSGVGGGNASFSDFGAINFGAAAE